MDAPDSVSAQFAITVPPEQAGGQFADAVSLWRTPNTFVLDFLSIQQLPRPVADQDGQVTHLVADATVASRVRIPPEQVFRLIGALQAQGEQWLQETGRENRQRPGSPTQNPQPAPHHNLRVS